MPKPLTWNDADKIGILLSQTHPDIEPSTLLFPDLQRLVTQLAEFHDDPRRSDDAKLQAIQQAWEAEFLDRTQS